MGLRVPEHLPLSDVPVLYKSSYDVGCRISALTAVVSVCFGCPINVANIWVDNNELKDHLTSDELKFINNNRPKKRDIGNNELYLESIWALLWSVALFEELDFTEYCGNNLKELSPGVGDKNTSALDFNKKCKIRSVEEIFKMEDLAYNLDWCAVEAIKSDKSCGLSVRAYVIRKRRHALSWLLSPDSWDSVPLDT